MYLSLSDRPGREAADQPQDTARPRPVARVVVLLGVVSLLTDISSESVAAILPLYLSCVVGPLDGGVRRRRTASTRASARSVRIGERVGGRPSPTARSGSRWSATGSPPSPAFVLLFATGLVAITAVLAVDRVGKGIRTAPRDAMISAATDPDAPRPRLRRAPDPRHDRRSASARCWPFADPVAGSRTGYSTVLVVSLGFAVVGVALLALFVPVVDRRAGPLRRRARRHGCAGADVATPRLRRLLVVAGVLGLLTVGDGFIYLALLETQRLRDALVPDAVRRDQHRLPAAGRPVRAAGRPGRSREGAGAAATSLSRRRTPAPPCRSRAPLTTVVTPAAARRVLRRHRRRPRRRRRPPGARGAGQRHRRRPDGRRGGADAWPRSASACSGSLVGPHAGAAHRRRRAGRRRPARRPRPAPARHARGWRRSMTQRGRIVALVVVVVVAVGASAAYAVSDLRRVRGEQDDGHPACPSPTATEPLPTSSAHRLPAHRRRRGVRHGRGGAARRPVRRRARSPASPATGSTPPRPAPPACVTERGVVTTFAALTLDAGVEQVGVDAAARPAQPDPALPTTARSSRRRSSSPATPTCPAGFSTATEVRDVDGDELRQPREVRARDRRPRGHARATATSGASPSSTTAPSTPRSPPAARRTSLAATWSSAR